MPQVVFGNYEWDDVQAALNLQKHGVSFAEAVSALDDPRAVYVDAGEDVEPRFAAIGMSAATRLLFVVHVERGERDRIISARLATADEETLYTKGP